MESATSSASTARRLRTDFLYTRKFLSSFQKKADGSKANRRFCPKVPIWPPSITLAVARVPARAVDRLELLERPARAHRHAGKGRLGQVARHLRLVPEALIQALQQGAPTGQ